MSNFLRFNFKMADNKQGMVVLGGLLAGLVLLITGFITFGLAGQIGFYVQATTEDSIWTPDYKYLDSTLPLDDGNVSTTDLNDAANLKSIYAQAKSAQEDNTADLQNIVSKGGLIAGLIGLVLVVTIFFMPNGIMDMVRRTNKQSE